MRVAISGEISLQFNPVTEKIIANSEELRFLQLNLWKPELIFLILLYFFVPHMNEVISFNVVAVCCKYVHVH